MTEALPKPCSRIEFPESSPLAGCLRAALAIAHVQRLGQVFTHQDADYQVQPWMSLEDIAVWLEELAREAGMPSMPASQIAPPVPSPYAARTMLEREQDGVIP